MSNNKYYDLTEEQRKAVFHKTGPLLVIAGPGSGKTRVITYRIAALIDSGVKPYNICAITFTNKAAEEMRQRAIGLGHSAGARISTFHSLCARILRQYATEAAIKTNFSIYDMSEQSTCMKRAVKDCDLDTSNFSPARMLAGVSMLKNKLTTPESFDTEVDDFFSKKLARVYGRYQKILAENNAMDFDDLLMKTALLLENSDEVCSKLADQFQFLLIDEYQDTNHAQYRIAKNIAAKHRNICATGDPDQSIYRWRGADIQNILTFEKDWADTAIVKLEHNFRSSPNILEMADSLITFNRKRKEKILIPTKPAGVSVDINDFDDEHAEAKAIADKIKDLVEKGTSLRDVAIFYRINAQSRVLEEAFIENQIPYQIVRGVEFYGRKEIRDILAYFKMLANHDDDVALLRIINRPARGIGKTTIDRLRNYAAANNITLFECLAKAGAIETLSKGAKAKIAAFVNMIEKFNTKLTGPLAPLAELVFTESGMERSLQPTGIADGTALDNVNELISSAAKYDKNTEEPSLADYLQQISLFSDADSYDPSRERVAMMTLHAAKGLEFENVFLIGLEDGLLPHERGRGDEDELEEERRLFFVGITRAKSGLTISYARYRTIRGQLLRSIPSQFLYELGTAFTDRPAEFSSSYEPLPEHDFDEEVYPIFSKGQFVRHKTFGFGTVKDFIDMGADSIIVVKFNTGQTKSLLLKYANLTKADGS